MNTLSYEDVIADENYNNGFDTATKKAKSKYNKLFNASKAWLHIYESSFGTPDEGDTPEYWELRKLLKMRE